MAKGCKAAPWGHLFGHTKLFSRGVWFQNLPLDVKIDVLRYNICQTFNLEIFKRMYYKNICLPQ